MHNQVKELNSKVIQYLKEEVVILDTETTGFSKYNDRIIEFAAIKLRNFKKVDEINILINPRKFIHPAASACNGITNEMVKDLESEEAHIKKIAHFLYGQHYIVGHNVNFDLGFIDEMFKRNGVNFECFYLDTLQLTRKYYPGLSSYKLSEIANSLGLKVEGLHRAGYDVDITEQLLKKLVENY